MNQYITVMIQRPEEKSEFRHIMELNIRQGEELENPALDPDDFDKTVEEKSKQIEQLDLLDDGFQELFDRVKDDLKNHQDLYRDEIAQMQDYIRKLTSKSATIQVQETRNKDLMTKKFASVHKQVREVRKSQRVVNQYYKNSLLKVKKSFTKKRRIRNSYQCIDQLQ